METRAQKKAKLAHTPTTAPAVPLSSSVGSHFTQHFPVPSPYQGTSLLSNPIGPSSTGTIPLWQPQQQVVLNSILSNLSSPPPAPVDPHVAAFKKQYSKQDIVQTYGYPSQTTVDEQDTLAQSIGDYVNMHDPQLSSADLPTNLPSHLAGPLREHFASMAPLSLGHNPLGDDWEHARSSYTGGMRGIPLYKALRSTPIVRNAISGLGIYGDGDKTPELHHALKKQDFPELAVNPHNLLVLSRKHNGDPGMHDQWHGVAAAKGGNRYQYALPAANVEMDRLLNLGAYKTRKMSGKTVNERVKTKS
ncbi:MAG TPA: hypothetical protein VN238_23250 [Solirubrobacteraceae bacterium]|nr:hypothetical protein [Solirubrobacteraceae bacterium]